MLISRSVTLIVLANLFGSAFSQECPINTTNIECFDYSSGPNGPAHWGNFAGSATCCTGRRQSPIDIGGIFSSRPPFVVNYNAASAKVTNHKRSLEVTAAGGSLGHLSTPNGTATLVNFHVHTPSEHRVNFSRYELEVHLVHQGATGTIVIGIFLDSRVSGGVFPLASAYPSEVARLTNAGDEVNIGTLDLTALGAALNSGNYFHYSGSLTTPPCTEGIQWYVLFTEWSLDSVAYARIRSNTGSNARSTIVPGQTAGCLT